MRDRQIRLPAPGHQFPFLFGGTFIEGSATLPPHRRTSGTDFPSFSEGLSLRVTTNYLERHKRWHFPSFSEGLSLRAGVNHWIGGRVEFPFLFGGTFIEGLPPLSVQLS